MELLSPFCVVIVGDVIMVTLNYRLGPFGFAANPQLRKSDVTNSTGNYGMLTVSMCFLFSAAEEPSPARTQTFVQLYLETKPLFRPM